MLVAEIKVRCPNCGQAMGDMACMNGDGTPKPVEGDYAMCGDCGHVSRIDAAGQLQPLTEEQWREMYRYYPRTYVEMRQTHALWCKHQERKGHADQHQEPFGWFPAEDGAKSRVVSCRDGRNAHAG